MSAPLGLLFLLISSSSLMPVCIGEDNIKPGNSIRGNQTIISVTGKFASGFFSPGNSSKSYLGIWYNDIPVKTVVWVANGASPLDSPGVLTLTRDGNLVVFDETGISIAWSSGTTVAPSSVNNTRVLLADSGNLALYRNESILWQSFDHPTDTVLPDMKLFYNRRTGKSRYITSWSDPEDPRPGKFTGGLDTTGPLCLEIWKGHHTFYRLGEIYSSTTLSRFGPSSTAFLTFKEDGDEIYASCRIAGTPAQKIRFTLSPAGQMQLLVWLQGARNWLSTVTVPRSPCNFYGICGRYSLCDINDGPDICKCFPGFRPKVQDEWNKRVWTNGCVREQALGCDGADGFAQIAKVKLPDHSHSQGYIGPKDCESRCRQNCSCTAYSYDNETRVNDGRPVKCLNWFGDLVDTEAEWISDGPILNVLHVRIHEEKQAAAGGKVTRKKRSILILIAILSTGLLAIVSACYFLWRTRFAQKERADGLATGHGRAISVKSGESDKEMVTFSFSKMQDATDNFCEENKLGTGGFGHVYKGILDDKEVAIKRLSKKSGQGTEEFMNEVKLIANLQHKNLVRLLGCCVEKEEKILVYEYLPKRSLDKILFDPTENAKFDWSKRFHIMEGVAQGLLYLHKYSRLKVIHRDLKASNILLDEATNPKISDFGMARMFESSQTEANTNHVVGTYGYMAPEYALYGKFSEKSDVYSFGVLLLEIVSSRRCTDFQYHEFYPTLLGWAWGMWNEGRGQEIIDQSIRDQCDHNEAVKCIHVGLLCIQESPADRPTMPSVVLMLSDDSVTLPSPKEPAFSTRTNPTIVGSSSGTSSSVSNNEMTISDQVAR